MLYHAIIAPKQPSESQKRVSIQADTIGEAWEQLIGEHGARNVQHVWADYGESKTEQ